MKLQPKESIETPKGRGPWPLITHGLAFLLGWNLKPETTPAKGLSKRGIQYVADVIEEWRPVNCRTERDCELALQNYLLGRFSQERLRVDRQFGFGSSRMDIVIENDFAIEIKLNLRDESEVKRLIGQAQEARSHFSGLVVVLCGDAEEALFNRLEHDLDALETREDESDPPFFEMVEVPIVFTSKDDGHD